MAKVQIVFHSTYGHVYLLAEQVAAGAREVDGTEVLLHQVAETIPEETLRAIGAWDARQQFAHIPIADPEQLAEADAIIIGTPTRFGNMSSQMRTFWDGTVNLWMRGALIGKIGSAFVATGSQHGGHETTITSIWNTFCHQGMLICGIPYSEKRLVTMEEITGSSPYGAGTMSGVDGSRMPTENELAIARTQGRHVATIAKRMSG
ncbi:MAG: NAD(P)H:quinone oxidoreductase [bacterium]|nr:NAD(P)H:quinone oxidoreductase [bacterium]